MSVVSTNKEGESEGRVKLNEFMLHKSLKKLI